MMETYLIVRVHGLLQHLLKPKDYINFLEEKVTLNELGYTNEEYDLERKINSICGKFIERIKFLEKIGGSLTPFFTAFLDFLEINNVKYKFRYLRGSSRDIYYIPYSHFIPFDRLISISDEEELMFLLSKTPYITILEPKIKRIKVSNLSLKVIEAILDAIYCSYYRYQAKIAHIKKGTLRLVDLEILIKYLYWLLNLTEEDIALLKNIRLIEEFLPKTFKVIDNIENILKLYNIKYDNVQYIINSKQISRLMSMIYKAFLRKVSKAALRGSMSQEYVYYYMLLCKFEMSNLERIIIGKKTGLTRELIEPALIFPPSL